MKMFLSYAHSDRPIAERIAGRLRAAGHEVWMDFDGIAGGSNWTDSIQRALQDADWVIVLISPKSISSRWARSETIYALELNKSILPILIEQTAPPGELIQFHYIDATGDFDRAISYALTLLSQGEPEKTDEPAPSEEDLRRLRSEVIEAPSPDRVFIAYAHAQRPLAKELADMLHEAGKAVFYDAHIRAGARWRQIIQSALDDATHVVVIWTPEARDSDEVEHEVSYALSEDTYIIPILSKDIPKLPYHLHGLHYLILEDDLSAIEQALLDAIDLSSREDEGIWQ